MDIAILILICGVLGGIYIIHIQLSNIQRMLIRYLIHQAQIEDEMVALREYVTVGYEKIYENRENNDQK